MTEKEFMRIYISTPYNDDTDKLLYLASKVDGNIGELAKKTQEAFSDLKIALRDLGFEFRSYD